LYQIAITANVMGAANTGPALETTSLGPLAARNSPVTEFFNASGVRATGTVGIVSDPLSWIGFGTRTVTVGTVTYSFVTGTLAASTATDVEVNLVDSGGEIANEEDTAKNLEAAIDANALLCATPPPCFGSGTVANASATASITGTSTIVNLTAKIGGAAGDFFLDETGGGINFSGGNNGGSADFIFFSTYTGNGSGPCPSGCVLSFDVTSGAAINTGTAPNAVLGVTASITDSADGFVTGGIIVDNDVMLGLPAGTSQIYFLTLDNAPLVTCSSSGSSICATQASQAGLN
jgi:hypothetical protein